MPNDLMDLKKRKIELELKLLQEKVEIAEEKNISWIWSCLKWKRN